MSPGETRIREALDAAGVHGGSITRGWAATTPKRERYGWWLVINGRWDWLGRTETEALGRIGQGAMKPWLQGGQAMTPRTSKAPRAPDAWANAYVRALVSELIAFVAESAEWECVCDLPPEGENGTVECRGCRARKLVAKAEGKP